MVVALPTRYVDDGEVLYAGTMMLVVVIAGPATTDDRTDGVEELGAGMG